MEKLTGVTVIDTNGDTYSMSTRTTAGLKVSDFKDLLAEMAYIPADELKLTLKGEPLKDDLTMDSYVFEEDVTFDMEVPKDPLLAKMETAPPSGTPTGDLGLSGLDSPTGRVPDMKLLSYQVISKMMRTLISSPRLTKQIIDQNAQQHDSIPQLSKMMQNGNVRPVVGMLSSTQMMQQMMISQLLPELNQYSLGILQPCATAVPLEQLYATQLSHLQETSDWLFDGLREYQGSTC